VANDDLIKEFYTLLDPAQGNILKENYNVELKEISMLSSAQWAENHAQTTG
jgi:hypothetical protein